MFCSNNTSRIHRTEHVNKLCQMNNYSNGIHYRNIFCVCVPEKIG